MVFSTGWWEIEKMVFSTCWWEGEQVVFSTGWWEIKPGLIASDCRSRSGEFDLGPVPGILLWRLIMK